MYVKLNSRAMRDLLNSALVVADLQARARRIAAASGPGMVMKSAERHATRARVAVVTGTFEAKHAEAKTRALTRALNAGR